ncbi:MAG TPA: alkaline phytoceramidase [Candidatus Methylomirabilis sp.]|nr:alkaline phytoceramidase [Candidatus Methylomirabilis sp.]
MTCRARLGLLWALLGAAVLAAAVVPPVPQDLRYHRMADDRTLWGIPNALNVLSSAPFILVGALGLWSLRPRRPHGRPQFVEACERWPYGVFFAGLGLTGVGSTYYHLAPSNERLVWDRLPLAVTLMGLFAAAIAERVGVKAGLFLLGPLVAIGIASVLLWAAGEQRGHGDLRLYALVQFYPLLAIPLLALLFPSRYTRSWDLLTVVALYGLAKLFELLDAPILSLGGVVSGHTLKHLTAALSGYWVWRMLVKRQPI